MVAPKKDSIFSPSPIRYASISAKKIIENNYRLDASAYDFEALKAIALVEKNKNGFTYLWSKNGYVENSFYGPRAKREYINKKSDSMGFLGSAEMLELNPKPIKFVPKSAKSDYRVDYSTILISRSGTIGNTTFVSKTLTKFCVSEHAIRVVCNQNAGYVYTFLHSETGKVILKSFTFGAVIDEIEPEHLCKVPIPNASAELKTKINDLIISSFKKRDESNDLIDKAQALLYSELKLPPLEEIKTVYYDQNAGFRNFTIQAKDLDGRFDASYHLPEVTAIIDILNKNTEKVTKLSDKSIVSDIILPSRFKRIYVDKENGIPFFGGKQLLQLCPTNLKYLSPKYHAGRIASELKIQKNMILVSCSGTIGKVMIAPKHWKEWAINQHCLRIIANSDNYAGYLYAWLDSPYATPLILRNTYGAVIDELDDVQMSNVIVPILKDKSVMKEINNLVLKANDLRYEAYLEEQKALEIMYTDVLDVEK